jgi:hypothetical protein
MHTDGARNIDSAVSDLGLMGSDLGSFFYSNKTIFGDHLHLLLALVSVHRRLT